MDGLDSPDLRRHRAVTLALVSRRPESPVWTWLALLVVLGGVVLALTGSSPDRSARASALRRDHGSALRRYTVGVPHDDRSMGCRMALQPRRSSTARRRGCVDTARGDRLEPATVDSSPGAAPTCDRHRDCYAHCSSGASAVECRAADCAMDRGLRYHYQVPNKANAVATGSPALALSSLGSSRRRSVTDFECCETPLRVVGRGVNTTVSYAGRSLRLDRRRRRTQVPVEPRATTS